jgi:hypothetical protein
MLRRIVANVLVDARPRFAEFKRDASEVWVSSEIGGTVSVIDPVKHEVKKKITFAIPGLRQEAIQAVGISITRDGKTGFVALGPANRTATESERQKKAKLVFAGLFKTLNHERSEVMRGIERYARKQKEFSDQIRFTILQLGELQNRPNPDQAESTT